MASAKNLTNALYSLAVRLAASVVIKPNQVTPHLRNQKNIS